MPFKTGQRVRIKPFPRQKRGKPALVLQSHPVGTFNPHGAANTYDWEHLVRDNQGRESRHYQDDLEAVEEGK
jgi:hypothetical protein